MLNYSYDIPHNSGSYNKGNLINTAISVNSAQKLIVVLSSQPHSAGRLGVCAYRHGRAGCPGYTRVHQDQVD